MAMKILQNNNEGIDSTTGLPMYRAHIVVDDADELPNYDGIEGVILVQGTVADVINEGTQYQLNSGGEWNEGNFSDAIRIKGRVDDVSELPENAKPGWLYFVGAATDPECAEYVYTEEGTWEHIGEGVPIEVDSALSTTSENPVQNKVLAALLNHFVFSANSKTYYLQPEQPSNPQDGDIWIG